ncbi:unnamed protein product, partial [Mesorhabditis belari]|uniref:FBA domain-containing protein n=1 Tax=Mesorhabditis belari TaxID=2138241 RepID=A0AAF3FC40_9BILA
MAYTENIAISDKLIFGVEKPDLLIKNLEIEPVDQSFTQSSTTSNSTYHSCFHDNVLNLPPVFLVSLLEKMGHIFNYSSLCKHAYEYGINPYGENLLKSLPLDPKVALELTSTVPWIDYSFESCYLEDPIVGYDLPGEQPKKCLVTSFKTGKRQIVIDLEKCGIEPSVFVHCPPRVIIQEKHAPRTDCGAIYKLSAQLLEDTEDPSFIEACKPQIEREYQESADQPWTVETIQLQCKSTTRRLVIVTEGRDTKLWAGNYGIKFADLIVRLEFPSG